METKNYESRLEEAKKLYQTANKDQKHLLESLFPEIIEDEDERVRKALIKFLQECYNIDSGFFTRYCAIPYNQMLAWLKKQVEHKPNYCHHEVDLSGCSEEYRKAYYDGWNNCNMQHSQCKSELNDVVKCLINGMKFYYEDNEEATWGTEKWSMPVKHIIEVLEKQSGSYTKKDVDNANKVGPKDYRSIDPNFFKPADKVEPKFKVGDCITDGEAVFHITSYDIDYGYQLETQKGTSFHFSDEKVENKYHLWTIKDAKDGDVLHLGCVIAMFKTYIGQEKCICYCSISEDGDFEIPIKNGEDNVYGCTSTTPATKEQRDILERAMTNAGYRWNKEELKLEKI